MIRSLWWWMWVNLFYLGRVCTVPTKRWISCSWSICSLGHTKDDISIQTFWAHPPKHQNAFDFICFFYYQFVIFEMFRIITLKMHFTKHFLGITVFESKSLNLGFRACEELSLLMSIDLWARTLTLEAYCNALPILPVMHTLKSRQVGKTSFWRDTSWIVYYFTETTMRSTMPANALKVH